VEYNGMAVLSAWKKFVNEGILNVTSLRPEVARSWLRCKASGLDPWGSTFDKMDEAELKRRRLKHQELLDASEPVLQYMLAVFNCNVSLSDMDAFVFELLTPLAMYSRTLGTYVLESHNGTGNLPLALIEKKPIRMDGFEHYRAVAQNYSGVSSIVELSKTQLSLILNMNDPFTCLPKEALETCVMAGSLIDKLYSSSRQELFRHLSTALFFDPLIAVESRAVIVIDQDGMILTANKAGRTVVTDYEDVSYAGQSLGEYLKDRHELFSLLPDTSAPGEPREVAFKATKSRKRLQLNLLRSHMIKLQNGMIHNVLIFDNPETAQEKADSPVSLRRSPNQAVDYIGVSAEWQKVDTVVQKIANHKSNVLLLGATGTGKEVVARAIHRLSGRKGEFVAINCGAIPRDLLASELFGYEGGAFTGARISGAIGKFEYANGGTLFLDEIGEMPIDMQVTLLRVLQEQTITRIGSNKQQSFDVRMIAATNQDIEQLIAQKRFRSDLRYRLSVIEIQLPLLKDRPEDILLLAQYFHETLGRDLCIMVTPLSNEVEQFLLQYDWPGNVRELKNVMEKVLILTSGKKITVDDFPEHMKECHAKKGFRISNEQWDRAPLTVSHEISPLPDETILTAKQQKERREKKLIVALIEKHCGNLSRVAKEMGISRNTLYRKISKQGIQIKVSAESNK